MPGSWARAVKATVPALTLVAGLATATLSHAATSIFLGSDSYSNTNTALLTGPVNINVYLTPQVYQANFGAAPSSSQFSLLVFCVDIYHFSGSGLAYDYDDGQPLKTNSRNGFTVDAMTPEDALSPGQVAHVGRLVNYGAKLYAADAMDQPDKTNKLAAVQGAIWQVINQPKSGFSITANQGIGPVNGLIGGLAGPNYLSLIYEDVGGVSSKIHFLKESSTSANPYGTSGSHQAFAIAAVPEPATWVMMIGGFAVAGGMLRRSRQRTESSVA